MNTNGNEMPLRPASYASYQVVNGVTYFKLKSEFPGDYTKNCGLLGEEIDQNFYFLRGFDIKDVKVDKNRNLIITRVDKDYAPLVVNIGEELGQPEFKFDTKTGVIYVTYPDGNVTKLEGFLVEGKDVKIATDNTLNGNGTMYNPLRLSETEKTGTYTPVNGYVDLTNGAPLGSGKRKGYRLVSKEKIDNFGCLYPFSAVKKIQDKLTETQSQWRVATKADWDELLNSFECKEHRNHSDVKSDWLGEVAGVAIKSSNLWKHYDTLPEEVSTEGQDIRNLAVYPLGISPERNEVLNDSDYDIEGYGQISGMWTNTLNSDGNAYVKIFGYNSAQVKQDTYGKGARMSIRLCKEYNMSNYNEIETILGFPYPTELVYGIHDDFPYVKIWTKINFYSDAEVLGGVRSEQWSAATESDRGIKILYYINEWDGESWVKKPMTEGDSVVILSKDGVEYREWRLKNGELIDVAKDIKDEFSDQLNVINARIDAEVSQRQNDDIILQNNIDAEIVERTKADEVLQNKIDEVNVLLEEEISNRKSEDIKLQKNIEDEINNRVQSDEQLHNDIVTETSERKEADKTLQNNITIEGETRLSADQQLQANIEVEASERKEEDKKLQTNIDTEAEVRLSADTILQTNIDAEVANRIEAITQEAALRVEKDAQLETAIVDETKAREDNDITPGKYILESNEELVIPTNGADVANLQVSVADDFFNFGTF